MSVLCPALALLVSVDAAASSPTTALEGDGPAVAALAVVLTGRGIPLGTSQGAALTVHVATGAAGFRLRIRDAEGRVVEREAASAELAATVIDSWLRSELDAPLLAARTLGPPAPPIAEAAPAPLPTSTLGLGAESWLGTDASVWWGAHVRGCVRWGSTCLGMLARVARAAGGGADGALYKDDKPASTTRLGAESLLLLERPLSFGRLQLVPAVALGLGWVDARAVYEDHDGQVATVGARAEAQLGLRVPLARGLAVQLGLAAKLAPAAHRDTFNDDGFTLPGEPWAYLQATAGLSFGPPP